MAVIVYECDTCIREIEIVRNSQGLNTINRCIITNGCKGTLRETSERLNGVFGKSIEDVDGLDNYRSRNILSITSQILSSSSWTISHNLNTDPTTHVYIDSVSITGIKSRTLLDPDEYVATYVNHNTTLVEFATSFTGIVHSVSRSSNPTSPTSSNTEIIFGQISANTILTIATDESKTEPPFRNITFISPSTSVLKTIPVVFTPHKDGTSGLLALFNTPWQSVNNISLGGLTYKVRSVRISDILTSNDIEDGSPFHFDLTDDFIILSSKLPLSTNIVDVEKDKVIFPESISSSTTSINSVALGNEIKVDESIIMGYYPSIKIISTIF
jgi:hypothetical protein